MIERNVKKYMKVIVKMLYKGSYLPIEYFDRVKVFTDKVHWRTDNHNEFAKEFKDKVVTLYLINNQLPYHLFEMLINKMISFTYV
jgi:hypothetical protein